MAATPGVTPTIRRSRTRLPETLLRRPSDAAFCASGAHGRQSAPLRFSKATPAGSPERVSRRLLFWAGRPSRRPARFRIRASQKQLQSGGGLTKQTSSAALLPSSSGQDVALSRRKLGFDSPWERHPFFNEINGLAQKPSPGV